jgi:hypothetical protein
VYPAEAAIRQLTVDQCRAVRVVTEEPTDINDEFVVPCSVPVVGCVLVCVALVVCGRMVACAIGM